MRLWISLIIYEIKCCSKWREENRSVYCRWSYYAAIHKWNDSFEKDEQDKILAILAFEKNRIEGKTEYEELIKNLMVFLDNERRYV